jgi:hypothetical protein
MFGWRLRKSHFRNQKVISSHPGSQSIVKSSNLLVLHFPGRRRKFIMAVKVAKINPHCCVPGCKADKQHADDPVVKYLISLFGDPAEMAHWTLAAMVELRDSICRDLAEKKYLAWFTRSRQPEELYYRTLYAMFIATPEELYHILSGDMPNGFGNYYREVNKVILQGKGKLDFEQPGMYSGTFKAMDMLNDAAHASFGGLATATMFYRDPAKAPSVDAWCKHLNTYCAYLNHMYELFKAGRDKSVVLAALKNMHAPLSTP